jgi:tetratricopeptide (TPR) repeat protein
MRFARNPNGFFGVFENMYSFAVMNRFCVLIFLGMTWAAYGQSLTAGKKFFEERQYAEAKRQLAPLDEDHRDFAAAQYYLGRIAFNEEQYEEAVDYLEEATEADDRHAEYFEWYGNALGNLAQKSNMVRQGMLAPRMKAAWEQAMQLDPKSIGPRTSLVEYYMQAPGFMGGSKEKAVATAREIIGLNAAEGHRVLGSIYAREKKVADAEKEYLEAARIDPQYKTSLAGFYLGQQLYEKAFALFDEALKKNPDDMLVVYQVGRTSAVSGQRLEQGEAALRKYLTHTPKANEPSLAGANMRLGQILEKKGNKAAAKKHYEVAVKLDATMKEAKEGLSRVSK